MNPYQKFVIFLGSSILIGVGYFVYKDIVTNVNSDSVKNSVVFDFSKKINSADSEKIIGVYSNISENDEIKSKLNFERNGNVFYTVATSDQDSSSTEKTGTWYIGADDKIVAIFINPRQKMMFDRGENDSFITLSVPENSESKSVIIYNKE